MAITQAPWVHAKYDLYIESQLGPVLGNGIGYTQVKNQHVVKNDRYGTGYFSMDWTERRICTSIEKWISSKENRMGLICHADSCQIKYIVWSTVFLKLAKTKEMDGAHSREANSPDMGSS